MSESRNFYLGCAVWSFKEWVGSFYPPNSKPGDLLRLYSQRLTAVEGNTTFYATPDRKTVARWAEETAAGFRFCPKLPRDITHQRLLQPGIPEALRFVELMQGLGDRLGPFFAQLPPHYGPERLADLLAFLRAWPHDSASLALEVRHPDWFTESHGEWLNRVLTELGVGRVLLDTRPIYDGPDDPHIGSERKKPRLPLQPSVTAPFTLVRFISHPEETCNRVYLEEWGARVKQWLEQNIRVYFFMHCPNDIHSPGRARRFQHGLEQADAPVPPLPWDALRAGPTGPTQLKLF
jgi:uncharacterized protein YecE (DUF72 family)